MSMNEHIHTNKQKRKTKQSYAKRKPATQSKTKANNKHIKSKKENDNKKPTIQRNKQSNKQQDKPIQNNQPTLFIYTGPCKWSMETNKQATKQTNSSLRM